MSLRFYVRQAPTQRNWPIFFVVIVVEKLRGCRSIIFRKSNTATFRPWLKSFGELLIGFVRRICLGYPPVSDHGLQRV